MNENKLYFGSDMASMDVHEISNQEYDTHHL
jgi:hypothetical protein